ncbi:MAG: hypothetical protein ACRYFZ_02180 [Janthinobacterium lividum]
MNKRLRLLTGLLILGGSCLATPALAQLYPVVGAGTGLVRAIAAQNAANKAIATKTTTTATYRGQSFLMKRTPDEVLTGDATDQIARLEIQLGFCYNVLLADTLNPTCPPERQAIIRAALRYLDVARPNWDQKAYRQELKFYLAEDIRRRRAID